MVSKLILVLSIYAHAASSGADVKLAQACFENFKLCAQKKSNTNGEVWQCASQYLSDFNVKKRNEKFVDFLFLEKKYSAAATCRAEKFKSMQRHDDFKYDLALCFHPEGSRKVEEDSLVYFVFERKMPKISEIKTFR